MSGEFRERRVWQENAARYLERAKIAARRKGFHSDADDLAQSLILSMLEGRHKHATIDQAIVDIIRTEYGRAGSRVQSRKAAVRGTISIHDRDNYKPRSYDPRDRMDDGLDYQRMVKALSKREHKIIFILTFKWGFMQTEIAEMFGISGARINHIVKDICKKLSIKLKDPQR